MDNLEIKYHNKIDKKRKSKKIKKGHFRDMWQDDYGTNKKNPYKRDNKRNFHDYINEE